MTIRSARAGLLIALPVLLLLGCQSGSRREPVRDTWVDPEASVPIIDVAIANPRVASEREAVIAPAMREAARRIMLDEKGYSVMTYEVVDAAMAKAGLDATADASMASSVVDADCLILVHVTKWNNDYLVPNGRVYASGTIRAAGPPNGRRIYEHTFQDEVLLSPGPVSQLGREEAEKLLAADLINRALASFRKKS
jgi:hypothetical protein